MTLTKKVREISPRPFLFIYAACPPFCSFRSFPGEDCSKTVPYSHPRHHWWRIFDPSSASDRDASSSPPQEPAAGRRKSCDPKSPSIRIGISRCRWRDRYSPDLRKALSDRLYPHSPRHPEGIRPSFLSSRPDDRRLPPSYAPYRWNP